MRMSSDAGSSIRDLSARLAREQLRSADRFSELFRRMASGQVDTTTVIQEAGRFARESAGEYTRSRLALSAGYRLALLDLSRQFGDRLLDRLLRSAEQVDAVVAEQQRAEIALTGPLGGEANAPFVIENVQQHPEKISFVMSEFTDTAGQAPFRPPLRLEPPQLTLAPGEEAVVMLHLPLLPELFEPGRLYQAKVVVSGHDLVLALTALAYQPTPTASRQRRPAQAKRTASPAARPARSSRPARPRNQGNGRPDDHAG
jgi:hypothetical protein